MLVAQLQGDGEKLIDRGAEIAASAKGGFAAGHEQSPTLPAHVEIERGEEFRGEPVGGNVVEDHGFGAGELARVKGGGIAELDLEALRAEHGDERILRVGRDEQKPRAAGDLD